MIKTIALITCGMLLTLILFSSKDFYLKDHDNSRPHENELDNEIIGQETLSHL
jgi:hypothetical protein